jgi:hypothetical protein
MYNANSSSHGVAGAWSSTRAFADMVFTLLIVAGIKLAPHGFSI